MINRSKIQSYNQSFLSTIPLLHHSFSFLFNHIHPSIRFWNTGPKRTSDSAWSFHTQTWPWPWFPFFVPPWHHPHTRDRQCSWTPWWTRATSWSLWWCYWWSCQQRRNGWWCRGVLCGRFIGRGVSGVRSFCSGFWIPFRLLGRRCSSGRWWEMIGSGGGWWIAGWAGFVSTNTFPWSTRHTSDFFPSVWQRVPSYTDSTISNFPTPTLHNAWSSGSTKRSAYTSTGVYTRNVFIEWVVDWQTGTQYTVIGFMWSCWTRHNRRWLNWWWSGGWGGVGSVGGITGGCCRSWGAGRRGMGGGCRTGSIRWRVLGGWCWWGCWWTGRAGCGGSPHSARRTPSS